MKSQKQICQFDLGFFVVSLSVPKLRRCERVGAINAFETASTSITVVGNSSMYVHDFPVD